MTHDPTPDDERMRALLHEAVAEVEPRDRLADVRRRTRARRTSSDRRWAPLLVGAGAVAATVVAATFVVTGLGDDQDPGDPPVAGTSTPTDDRATTAAAAIYYTAPTPTGERLFREFQAVTPTSDPELKVLYALQRLTEDTGPRDSDYLTTWPADSFEAVRIEADRIVVELGDNAVSTDRSLFATLAPQQVVYTAEAAIGDTLPVSFEHDGAPVRDVLGVRVDALVERDRSSTLVAPVNITDPSEHLAVDGDVLSANGTMSSNARRLRWQLRRAGETVLAGRPEPLDITGPDARATLGAPGWETGPIDISGLAPGEYELVVHAIDVGQTSDSSREFSDTRTITVR